VLFEPAMLGHTGARLIMLNPLSPIVEGFRLAIVEGHNLLQPLVAVKAGQAIMAWSPWYLASSCAWATIGFAAAVLGFHRAEFRFVEVA
jgi:ABC-type polysaccharide/polyol phosphate export permease